MIILLASTAIAMTIAMAKETLAQSSSGSTPVIAVHQLKYKPEEEIAHSTIHHIPQSVQVKQGQSVMWYNPSKVGEPHTVTFALGRQDKTRSKSTDAVQNTY